MKSTVPVPHGCPNPYFDKVKDLVEKQPQLSALFTHIQSFNLPLPELLSKLETDGTKDSLRKIFFDFKNMKDSEAVQPPPPIRDEVYGRIGKGTNILDVGSGNCTKLVKYSGDLKIVACDPEVPTDMPHGLLALPEPCLNVIPLYPDHVLTSFMSLPQMDEQTRTVIENRDGVHLIPDHGYLLKSGIAVPFENKFLVRTHVRNYIDWPLSYPGYDVAPGYKLTSFFQNTEVGVLMSVESSLGSYTPTIDCSPISAADVNLNDVSWKYDGLPFEFEFHMGQVYASNRAGEQWVGVTNFSKHMCIHLEFMGCCFILLRVVSYKNFVPPHCLQTLQAFVSKVSIFINGMPVYSPAKYDPSVDGHVSAVGMLKSDGVITRRDGFDYYCKQNWTLDFKPLCIEKFTKLCADDGFTLSVDRVDPGLAEYRLSRVRDKVKLSFVKVRNDKTTATTIGTAKLILDSKNLSEVEALIGGPISG